MGGEKIIVPTDDENTWADSLKEVADASPNLLLEEILEELDY